MSSIRSKNTAIELLFAKNLRICGIRYRRYPKLLGSPDFLIFNKKKKALVFIDGDFWHGWDYKKRKAGLSVFWQTKIENNVRRDRKNGRELKKLGWTVIRIWEHELRASPLEVTRRAYCYLNKKSEG